MTMNIPLTKPNVGKEEVLALKKVFKSGWITAGPRAEEFEEKFRKYVDSKYAVAVSSCTAALHVSLVGLGIKKGDDVLLPSLAFVGIPHVVLYTGAKPVFVDVIEDTLCIDPNDIERKITSKTKAIIVVHFAGHAAPMDEIYKIANKHRLFVVEDAAHAAGALYKSKRIGSLEGTSATCFSFHALKNMTTGDGGMITTNNKSFARHLRKLCWMGISKNTWDRFGKKYDKARKSPDWYYEVKEIGFKYYMNDIAAAIGIEQLKKLKRFNARRRAIAKSYDRELKKIGWVSVPSEKNYAKSVYYDYIIRTPYRDRLHDYLKKCGITTSVHVMPSHLHPYYKKLFRTKLPITDKVWKEVLCLPLYPSMTKKEFHYIITSLKKFQPPT